MNIFDKFFKRKRETVEIEESNTKTNEYPSLQYDIHPILKQKLEDDLLPGEIVLLDWSNSKKLFREFPRYFAVQYGIIPEKSQQQLISRGLLEIKKHLAFLKVKDLKEILLFHNLSTSGKKEDLIARIEEQLELEELDIPFMLYVTPVGETILNKYNGIISAHKDRDFTVVDFIEFSKKHKSSFRYNDIKWAFLNDDSMKNTLAKDYGLLRNNRMAQARMLESENRKLDSLALWIEVLLLDLSGLHNNFVESDKLWYFENMAVQYVVDKIKLHTATLERSEIDLAFDRAKEMFFHLRQRSFLSEKDIDYFRENLILFNSDDYNEYMKKYEEQN